MRKRMLLMATLGAVVVSFLAAWRRNRRIGTAFMNRRVDAFLVRRGLCGGARSELGTLEHVGRRTGTRHLTPVHPEQIENGYRILLPLGLESEWARNVLAAGHCRLQLHGVVHELDEPAMLLPREMDDLPAAARLLCGALGFTYLRLHRFGGQPGTLEEIAVPAGTETAVPGAAVEAAAGAPEASPVA